MEREKIFASHVSEKGFICKLCKELIQLYSKKKERNPIKKKIGREIELMFSQIDTNVQKVHEKVLNITNYQGNIRQNHSRIASHTT